MASDTDCRPTPTTGHPPGYSPSASCAPAACDPAGQDIAAQILWRHRKQRRVAYLYREDQAKPKRTATTAQLAAIAKALRARRTCPTCGTEKPYCIPRSKGECNDCAARWDR